ncbi:MAG TPA: hypothetical protein VIT92_00855 [Burkholderiaceae bacterium]
MNPLTAAPRDRSERRMNRPSKAAPATAKAGKAGNSPDNRIAYMAVAFAMVLLGAAAAWFYLHTPAPSAPAATYTKVGPVSFKVDNQSARVTLDLQSLTSDGTWAKANYGALETVIESVLADTDPALMNAPNNVKFENIQKRLTTEINKNFPEAKIDQVFVTDYVTAQN